ncbi:hypothetical protein FOZ63_011406 [Perkinsus olseni]|uniref:Uncharacterized protein n=1 Tax=Perkinsus olseni TaxID=32597 RepID=A0A7J6RXT4_PEROL|nr:hypothetical protein FOZ63_011406 [Perkinsus olseni]
MDPCPVSAPVPYTYEVPNSAVPGVSGPIYRHPEFPDNLLNRLDGNEALVTSFDVFRDVMAARGLFISD